MGLVKENPKPLDGIKQTSSESSQNSIMLQLQSFCLVERVQFFVVTLIRISLYSTKLCSIYTSKAKDYRYQVTEGVYAGITCAFSGRGALFGL